MGVLAKTFIVKKNDLKSGKFVESELAAKDGGAILQVDHFALTANNITYAVAGDMMQYWNFFPAPEDGYGIVPVWGFGTVVDSKVEGLSFGDRFYGYFPFASHVAVEPVRVSAGGFSDGAAHRQPMAAVYNNYTRTTADPLYDEKTEAEQMLLRPLFTTSFAIDDMLDDNGYFGAKAVILTSASSKTAYAAAYLLKKRKGVEVIGLTSRGNMMFVKRLGCYDRVVAYDDIASLDAGVPVAVVDMAGNGNVRSSLHHHYGDNLKYDLGVGITNWDAERGTPADLPGAKPTMFFAPTQIAKRSKEWGAAVFGEKLAAAWHDFVAHASDPASPWFRVIRERRASDVQKLYLETLAGKTPPMDGLILSL
ncbi:MAG TPA: DUF2855 family protein [Rhizomicrobium sp.]|jgi:hypothetical protein|nr:DUF2855 family protein [Rhizomicrobium sp.]